jgi:hypothetical protein
MQIYVQDLFVFIFSYMCHDKVSYHDTTNTSLFINWYAISAFCQHGMYDTTYDTSILASLMAVEYVLSTFFYVT